MTNASIHPSALVSSRARIGRDVQIGPFSVIEDDVVIGDGCRIGSHISIMRYTSVGAGCEIHAGAVLGDLPQDLGFKNGQSFVEIGDGCVIREGVTVHRGTAEGSVTKIGARCFLMAYSHVAHNVVVGDNVIMANGALLAGHVHVGDRAFISGNAAVHQFVRIGRLALMGPNSMVAKDLPPFCMIEPCSWNGVKGLNIVGMRRAGMGPEERAEVKRAFKFLYASGLNVTQALEKIDADAGKISGEIAAFVRGSKRGICGSILSLQGDRDSTDSEG